MKILYLLIGWVLGLFSPIFVDWIRRPQTRKDLKKAFFAELNELRLRLVYASHLFTIRSGVYDREFITWVQSHIKECTETELSVIHPKLKEMSDRFEKVLEAEDEEIAQLGKAIKSQSEGTGLAPKKYALPLITANIASLTLFKSEFQVMIFEIISRTDTLNQEIENAQFYFENTFNTNLEEENQKIVRDNLDQCYRNIARQTQLLADNIKRVMSQ
jgi:hypothetical protein